MYTLMTTGAGAMVIRTGAGGIVMHVITTKLLLLQRTSILQVPAPCEGLVLHLALAFQVTQAQKHHRHHHRHHH